MRYNYVLLVGQFGRLLCRIYKMKPVCVCLSVYVNAWDKLPSVEPSQNLPSGV